MARPGKAIFDVTMMAGWAFAAVLTGLVALTVVDETGDSANNSSVVASLDKDGARLVTGSVPASEENDLSAPKNELISEQNQSFNPFQKKSLEHLAEMQQVLSELKALRREVAAFHVSARGLRNENNLLKQRLAKVELSQTEEDPHVRVVDLPKRDDARSVFVTAKNNITKNIDSEATGSIAPVAPVPVTGQTFDPFVESNQSQVKMSVEPFNMDLTVEDASGGMMLPKKKPLNNSAMPSGVLRPNSEVISMPIQAPSNSQTAFGLDLGQFVSLSDLGSAWKEISISQRQVVGDLRALSRVSQGKNDRLALNLILGPIQNAAQAASLCAQLKFRGYACGVSVFQGQALAQR